MLDLVRRGLDAAEVGRDAEQGGQVHHRLALGGEADLVFFLGALRADSLAVASGAQLDQGLWLALGLAVIGSLLLATCMVLVLLPEGAPATRLLQNLSLADRRVLLHETLNEWVRSKSAPGFPSTTLGL